RPFLASESIAGTGISPPKGARSPYPTSSRTSCRMLGRLPVAAVDLTCRADEVVTTLTLAIRRPAVTTAATTPWAWETPRNRRGRVVDAGEATAARLLEELPDVAHPSGGFHAGEELWEARPCRNVLKDFIMSPLPSNLLKNVYLSSPPKMSRVPMTAAATRRYEILSTIRRSSATLAAVAFRRPDRI